MSHYEQRDVYKSESHPPLLVDAAKKCREVFLVAQTIDADLWGCSVLDLMADNIPNISLLDLKSAILMSGIYAEANDRIKAQIAGYR